MLIHRQQSHRTTRTFRSSRSHLTAGSTRTTLTAGTVLTAGTEGSFRGKPTYEAPKRLCETATQQHTPSALATNIVPLMAVDQELDRVLERIDSATATKPSSRGNQHGKSSSQGRSKRTRQRNTPTRMFGFFRRRDGTKTAVPVKPKAKKAADTNKKSSNSNSKDGPIRGKGMLVAASASLQKKQYSTSAQETLSRDAAQVFGNKRNVERNHPSTSKKPGPDPVTHTDSAKAARNLHRTSSSSNSKRKVERTSSSKSKTKKSGPTSEEELLGSILSIPVIDLNDSASSKSVKAPSQPTATDSMPKKTDLQKQNSCRSLVQAWANNGEESIQLDYLEDESEEESLAGDSFFGESHDAPSFSIPAPPCLQVKTSMSSASEWKTTVSATSTSRNGETFSSPLKTWSTTTGPMVDRNGTPFFSSGAKPKLNFESSMRLSKTDLISDDSDSDGDYCEEEWVPPVPGVFEYTTSLSSVNSQIMLKWSGGAAGTTATRNRSCIEDAVPAPPLVALSSLSLKQPQRKKSLSTRADSPPTLQFTPSLESVKSHWSCGSSGGHPATPRPPATTDDPPTPHQHLGTTNEIVLPAVNPTMPTNVVEISGASVHVRPLEEAILYVAAEVTGSSSTSSRIVETVCKLCRATNCHVCDCAYVLCPECQTVMPTTTTTTTTGVRSSSADDPRWGVGLGFSPDLRTLWLDQLLGGSSAK